MHIERIRPAVFEITLHAYELTALVAAARWAVEGGRGDMKRDVLDQLRTVLESYEAGISRMNESQSTGSRSGR